LQSGKISSALILDGPFQAATFNYFVEYCLLPTLKPNSVVVLDNANIHNKNSLSEILGRKNCELIFQPKYSPDLNEIEHHWTPLKSAIRKELAKNLDKAKPVNLFQKATDVFRMRIAI
jgi:transposase